jgi:hypothetical protein
LAAASAAPAVSNRAAAPAARANVFIVALRQITPLFGEGRTSASAICCVAGHQLAQILAEEPRRATRRRSGGNRFRHACMCAYCGGNQMKYASILALGALLGLAAPGLALAECQRPAAPVAKADGAKATMEEIQALKKDVVAFMTASDEYQGCLIDEVKAKRDEAAANKTKIDPAIPKAADEKIKENQADKERVGAEFNATAKAYKAAHPS